MGDRADSIRIHDAGADEYDQQVEAYESHAHDLLFGLSHPYAGPGQRLLDLGIGTGLTSEPFDRAGLEIYGADGSAEMLRVCRAKGFARERRLLDLRAGPWPYPDRFFAHALACGLLHFLEDLAPFMGEVARLLGGGGVFVFTVAAPAQAESGDRADAPDCMQRATPWGVNIFVHQDRYLRRLLARFGFRVLKRQRYLAKAGEAGRRMCSRRMRPGRATRDGRSQRPRTSEPNESVRSSYVSPPACRITRQPGVITSAQVSPEPATPRQASGHSTSS